MVERWHVGKEIPLALIFSIMMSVGSGVWYASTTSARIAVIEEKMIYMASTREDIILLKEQVTEMKRLLIRMEGSLDRRSDLIKKTDRIGTVE